MKQVISMKGKLTIQRIFFYFLISFLVPTQGINAQFNTTTRWQDYFSYKSIHHIWEIDGLVYCSAENGLFSYDPTNGNIEKISKVNGLNDIGITAFHYSPELNMIMVGYERGEMDFITPEASHNQLEIPLHQSYTGNKKVNHIYSSGNTAIIAGDFGLATFSLENFEFMETTYFLQSGAYISVSETTIFNGNIYAVTTQGIYTHPLNDFIANFNNWEKIQEIPGSPYHNIVSFNGNIFANSWSNVYRFDGNNWSLYGNFPELIDLTTNGNTLSFVFLNQVINMDENLNTLETIPFSQTIRTALKIGNTTYGGSMLNGLIIGSNEIYPDGPYSNKSVSVTALNEQIWIAPGGANNFNAPLLNSEGFFHFDGTKWNHIKSSDMLNAKDILHIEVNPSNPAEVYASSWFEYTSWSTTNERIGFLRFENNVLQDNYLENNSIPEGFWRVGGSTFDEDGNLWVSQSYNPTHGTLMAKRTPNGNWQSKVITSTTDAGIIKPVVYNGYAFVGLPRPVEGGVKITDMQNVYTINIQPNKGNLPASETTALAIDKDGVLWIGTILGLRVLYNPIETVQQDSFETFPIIIEHNGIPEALFNDMQINDIEVDGANNKWIATETSGVFYISEDGMETIYNFKAENSPLPSNLVYDIEVDPSTGVVYFATEKGVVSYRSDAVEVGDSFGDVYAYPNPVRPGFNGVVTIKGLPNDADVRIVDVVGNVVYQTKSSGGVAQWDTKNMKGKPVASGIYIVLMTNKDASQNKQTKIAIVR